MASHLALSASLALARTQLARNRCQRRRGMGARRWPITPGRPRPLSRLQALLPTPNSKNADEGVVLPLSYAEVRHLV